MMVLVMDGQGGKLGAQLVREIASRFPVCDIMAVGTNTAATQAMLKAGAGQAATGENAARVACRRARAIVGPIGIVVADALLGEITPDMARCVGQSDAVRILLPMNRCDTLVAGLGEMPAGELIADAMNKLAAVLAGAEAR